MAIIEGRQARPFASILDTGTRGREKQRHGAQRERDEPIWRPDDLLDSGQRDIDGPVVATLNAQMSLAKFGQTPQAALDVLGNKG